MSPLLALVLAAAAQEGLTADDAVKLALENSPALRAVEARRREEQEKGAAATAVANPQLRLQNLRSDRLLTPALTGQQYSPHPLANAQLGLRWDVPDPFSILPRASETEALVQAVDAELEATRRELAARTRALHATALSLQRQAALAKLGLELRGQLVDLARRRVEAQAARGLEENVTQLDQLEAQEQALELARRRREVLRELAVVAGLPMDSELEVAGAPLECRAPEGSAEELAGRAVERAPALAKARARHAALRAAERRSRLQLIPWFDYLQVGYVFGTDDTPAWGVLSLGVRLPLFDWHGHQVGELEAQGARLDADAALARRGVESDVRRLLADVREDAAVVARYQAAEPQMIERSLDQLQRAVAAGQSNLVELATVQARSLGARRAGLRSELHCQLALIELERLGVTP